MVCGRLVRFMNGSGRMSDGTLGWMTAAKCCDGPRPGTTFAELPRQDKREIVRVAVVSTAAALYIVTLGVMTKPIPSRNLVGGAVLPSVPEPRPALPAVRPEVPMNPASPRSPDTEPVRATYEPIGMRAPANAVTRRVDKPTRRQRRGGFFGRFFRGIARGVQPGAGKANTP